MICINFPKCTGQTGVDVNLFPVNLFPRNILTEIGQ